MSANNRLIHPPRHFDRGSLTDVTVLMMANLEDAMVAAGAEPAAEYTRLDLLREAMPFVLSMFVDSSDDPLMLTTEWPAHFEDHGSKHHD